MTLRQRILQLFYPVLMYLSRKKKPNKPVVSNTKFTVPKVSFYDLSAALINGSIFKFDTLKGKKVMIVNTASDCGFTPQYAELETLYKKYQHKLVIIAFPANDFKEQEKDTDSNIAKFCAINYGVSFPLMKKCVSVKTAGQHAVFKWLSDAGENGWNNQAPVWNFSKYLINEAGVLTHFFNPTVSPLSSALTDAIEE